MTSGVLSIVPAHSAGPAEGNGIAAFALAGGSLHALAGLVSPGAVGGVAQIERPLFVGGFAFTASFVGEREIEMHVRVSGHGTRGAAQMFHGFVKLAEFFESAAEVVERDAIERINLHGGEKAIARVGELAQLIVGDAKVDVRFDPIRSQIHDTLIIFDRLGQSFGVRFAIERGLKEIFGSGAGHGVQFRGLRSEVKWESPLAQKRIEGTFGAGRNDVDFAAEFDQAEFLDRHGPGAELHFHQSDGAAHTIGGHAILGDALYGAQGYEIAEAVKSLAPAGFGPHQAQAFPIAKTVRLKTQDAPDFISRISLRQSARPPHVLVMVRMIMHLVSTLAYGTRLCITWRRTVQAKVKSENRKLKMGGQKRRPRTCIEPQSLCVRACR